jgi:hypothetical protein
MSAMLPQREAVVVRYGIVIVGQNPHAEPEYGRLIGPNVMCGMRSTGWGGTEQLRRWRRQGTNYMLTVASSDFVHYQGQSLYQGDSFVRTVLADRNCVGLYLHEVVAYYAQVPQPGDPHRWDWRWAATQVDYARINRWVEAARARGKVVAWSEPARGWWALNERPEVSPYVWPVFATNFVSATAGDHWARRRSGAERPCAPARSSVRACSRGTSATRASSRRGRRLSRSARRPDRRRPVLSGRGSPR